MTQREAVAFWPWQAEYPGRRPEGHVFGLTPAQLHAVVKALDEHPRLATSQLSAALTEQELTARPTDLERALRRVAFVDGAGRWSLEPAPWTPWLRQAEDEERRQLSAAAAAKRYSTHSAFLTEALGAAGEEPWLLASTARPASAVLMLRLQEPTWWVAVMRPSWDESRRRLWNGTPWARCPTADIGAWSLASGDCAPARGEEFLLICARPERDEVQRTLQMALMRRGADSAETTTVRRLSVGAAAALPLEAAFRHVRGTMSSATRSGADAVARQGRRGPVRGACGRCGQPLSDATSVSRGYGPRCWEYERQERARARLGVRHAGASARQASRVVVAVRAALLAGVLG